VLLSDRRYDGDGDGDGDGALHTSISLSSSCWNEEAKSKVQKGEQEDWKKEDGVHQQQQ